MDKIQVESLKSLGVHNLVVRTLRYKTTGFLFESGC